MARLVLLVVALVLGAAAAYGEALRAETRPPGLPSSAVTVPILPPRPADCPCSKGPGCRAASPVPPGGLATKAVPFFIVLTVDDAITVVSQPVVFNLTARHTNHNGCRMPATCARWPATPRFTSLSQPSAWQLHLACAQHSVAVGT